MITDIGGALGFQCKVQVQDGLKFKMKSTLGVGIFSCLHYHCWCSNIMPIINNCWRSKILPIIWSFFSFHDLSFLVSHPYSLYTARWIYWQFFQLARCPWNHLAVLRMSYYVLLLKKQVRKSSSRRSPHPNLCMKCSCLLSTRAHLRRPYTHLLYPTTIVNLFDKATPPLLWKSSTFQERIVATQDIIVQFS